MRMRTGGTAKVVCLVMVMVMVTMMIRIVEGGSWCVAKIGAREEELQKALDAACSGEAAADCAPIQPDGLCYIPNTIQAHASYAFNTFYQRNARDPHACLFAGTSTIAQTDPSYGSCVYPSSATASSGGVTSTSANTNTNTSVTTPAMDKPNAPAATTTAPIHGGDGAGMNPLIPENSTAPSSKTITTSFLVFLIIFSLIP